MCPVKKDRCRGLQRISAPEHFSIGAVSLTHDESTVAFSGAGPNQFREVYRSGVREFAPKALTNFAADWKDFISAVRMSR